MAKKFSDNVLILTPCKLRVVCVIATSWYKEYYFLHVFYCREYKTKFLVSKLTGSHNMSNAASYRNDLGKGRTSFKTKPECTWSLMCLHKYCVWACMCVHQLCTIIISIYYVTLCYMFINLFCFYYLKYSWYLLSVTRSSLYLYCNTAGTI